MIEESRGEGRLWAGLVVLLIISFAVWLRGGPPAPLGDDAATNLFSASRAKEQLETVLADEASHPIGSPENAAVRQRIVDRLEAMGYEPQLETGLACRGGSCGIVSNVIVRIPGREPGPAVLINAHYDSVPAGPGAGDDGIGVATLLEVARAMKGDPEPRYPIVFLFDDGEEAGLLGAEYFVRNNEAGDYIAVIVAEARGSSGPAVMFETHGGNLSIIRAFSDAVDQPLTSSLFFSLYQRLPNRTNLTVFKREGFKGMAFAIVHDPRNYHTPSDSLERLSDATLQHMGDQSLAMVRHFAEYGLPDSTRNASYFDFLRSGLVAWPENWNLGLSILGLLLVLVAGFMAMRAEKLRLSEGLVSFGSILLVVVLAGGLSFALNKLFSTRVSDVLWSANGNLAVLAIWAVAFFGALVPFAFVRRPPRIHAIWLGVWLAHAAVSIALSQLLPGFAYVYFIPAIAAGLLGVISFSNTGRRSEGALIVPFIISLVLVMPILSVLYVGMGFVILPLVGGLGALAFTPLTIYSSEARRSGLLVVFALVVLAVSTGLFFLTNTDSEGSPRPLNVAHIQTQGAKTARVVLLGATGKVPDEVDAMGEWTNAPVESLAGSGRDAPNLRGLDVEPIEAEYPRVLQYERSDTATRVRLRPVEQGSVLRFMVSGGLTIRSVSAIEETIQFDDPRQSVTFRGATPGKGIVLELEIPDGGEAERVTVRESRHFLPTRARAIADARPVSSVPIGPGDRSVFEVVTALDQLESISTESSLDADAPAQ